MKKTPIIAFVLVFSMLNTLTFTVNAEEDPPDDLLGIDDLFGGDNLDDLFPSEPSEPEETDVETEEDTELSTEEAESGEAQEVSDKNLETSAINKNEYEFYKRIPGAIQEKGVTFLSITSKKTIGKYMPCNLQEDQTTMTRLARLKLSQGAPITCRENVGFRLLPYRMYRKDQ